MQRQIVPDGINKIQLPLASANGSEAQVLPWALAEKE
jgi:hypothetical protein